MRATPGADAATRFRGVRAEKVPIKHTPPVAISGISERAPARGGCAPAPCCPATEGRIPGRARASRTQGNRRSKKQPSTGRSGDPHARTVEHKCRSIPDVIARMERRRRAGKESRREAPLSSICNLVVWNGRRACGGGGRGGVGAGAGDRRGTVGVREYPSDTAMVSMLKAPVRKV